MLGSHTNDLSTPFPAISLETTQTVTRDLAQLLGISLPEKSKAQKHPPRLVRPVQHIRDIRVWNTPVGGYTSSLSPDL